MPNSFDKAIEVLERQGWTKGKMMTLSGKVCLVGALGTVVSPGETCAHPGSTPEGIFLENFCHYQYNCCPESFNDDDLTTLTDVKYLLEQVSQAWESEHHDN